MEAKLKTLESSATLRLNEAILSSSLAISSLDKYRIALRNALDEAKIDDDKEAQWKLVTDLFETQTADVNEANQKFSSARKSIEELEKCVNETKTSEIGQFVKNLPDIQIDLINAHGSLETEQTKVTFVIYYKFYFSYLIRILIIRTLVKLE